MIDFLTFKEKKYFGVTTSTLKKSFLLPEAILPLIGFFAVSVKLLQKC